MSSFVSVKVITQYCVIKSDCVTAIVCWPMYIGSEVGVVEGLERGIEKMTKGEEAEFVIQPSYGFGSNGNAEKNVPPNTEVTYSVTLTDFVKVL